MSDDPFDKLRPVPPPADLPPNVTPFGPVRKRIGKKSEELRRKIRFAGDIQPATDCPYLIKDWLQPGTLAVLYGAANVGKTFLALDIANTVSRGETWGGCRVSGAPVLYVTLEGGQNFDRRVAALTSPNFYILSEPLCFLHPDRGPTWLAEAVDELAAEVGDFGLIVIDTLARAMSPGDENTSQDMGRLIASVELLKQRTGAWVLLIHHTGKNAAQGARGHSSLRAAIDTEIEVTKEDDDDVIEAKATKQRDMEVGRTFRYQLREVELGRDQDGDAVTTCVVERAAEGEKPRRATVKGKAAIALQALQTAIETHGLIRQGECYPHGLRSVTKDQWRDCAVLHGMFEGIGEASARPTFDRAVRELNDKALVRCFGDIWWRTGQGETP